MSCNCIGYQDCLVFFMTDEEKTPSERVREDALLKNLIETVSLRNNIVDSIEEDRIRSVNRGN